MANCVNLRTAKTLGLDVPARCSDEVIEYCCAMSLIGP
jgi:hypothetical protein